MVIFIVNPVSGNGRGKKIWSQLESVLEERQIVYTVHFTKGPKHATFLAKEILKVSKVEAVIVVGGDGTLHEVAQGLIGTHIPLGCIPAGSGNDFARAFRISTNSTKALDMLLSSKPYKIDVAQINDGFFVNGAGIGFDGAVARMTNESKIKCWLNRMKLGRLAYVIIALRLLCTFRPIALTLTIDGKHYFYNNVWLIAVSNIPFYGGGMSICPDAMYDDGLLDLCIVSNINRFHFLRSLVKVFKGKHTSEPGVIMMRGRKISVQSKKTLPIHTDGECYQPTSATINVQRRALNVLYVPFMNKSC
ncbi:diacylglycerol/lipid kinase family protein [Aneurinibacillus danicus]|uniref:Diacylglycerol kinase n=1 Tax=Aneurinibacillus danicus TaxID=267746 RepID=A0A511V7M9_9BACL|nr:diacylglycerol kinase family protein [Aneurinibacillus danicus]GEN33693.1 diacylglycerol kinase [Aneurinibacillus danicus]